MNLRERAKRVQEPLLKALADPRAMILPHDVRLALAELSAFVGELVIEVETLKGGRK